MDLANLPSQMDDLIGSPNIVASVLIAIIAILQVNGINISALAAGLGIIGIIVASAEIRINNVTR